MRGTLLAATILACLACGGVVPVEEPPPPVGTTRCLSVQGRDVGADLRLVTDGNRIVGGSLSWVDRSTGTSGVAEPLTGTRKNGMTTATGPRFDDQGQRRGTVEVRVGRDDHRKLAMAIDGEQVLGRVKARPCTGDL